jgi:hypothetical protein
MYAVLSAQTISTIDVVKVKAQYEKEAMYFYTENWLQFRQSAMKQNVISGYEMLRTATDSVGYFNMVLITEYADSTSFRNMESNFAPIMKRIAPNGPKMLNDVPRTAFLEYVSGYDLGHLYSKRNKSKKKKNSEIK